ncbi:MAG: carotenoid biosynthesis protein [Bacteroidota bacterium]
MTSSRLISLVQSPYTFSVSVFILWLTYVSVLVGMNFGYTQWFISMTPLNQLLCFILLMLNYPILNSRLGLVFLACFAIGFGAEQVGVHTGILFGDYAYLHNFGPKFAGVPWLIGVNWALLAFITYGLCSTLPIPTFLQVMLGSLLMVLLDVLMEPLAPGFGFWAFSGNEVPVWNYICWFMVALPMHLILVKVRPEANRRFCAHLLAANFIFFITANVIHSS